jgi:predicted nucleic acid-binding protein
LIALDTNLLVYAHRKDSAFHEPARQCLREHAEATNPWAIAWPCLHEFLAIVTHPKILRKTNRVVKWIGLF